MSDRLKTFLGIAFVAIVFTGAVLFVRGQFEGRTGLELPLLAVPLKYEANKEDSPRRYIVFVTLPSLASGIIRQQPYWAGDRRWSNERTNMLFAPGRRLLRGTELTWKDDDIWYINSSDQVDERNYITGGDLVIVRTDNGFVYYLGYY